MPNIYQTRYRYVVDDLKDLAVDLINIAQDTPLFETIHHT